MRAIVLSAGRGSRMGALTAEGPKCLLEIDGVRLLDRQVAAFRSASIREIAVVTGWCAHRFEGMPYRLFHNGQWAESSMVESLACAESWLREETTVVCYGDIVVSAAAVEAVADEPASIAVAYDPGWAAQWAARFDDPLTDAETFRIDGDGAITEIGGTPHAMTDVEGQYLGLLKFEPDGWTAVRNALADAVRSRGRKDMTGLLGRLIRNGFRGIRGVEERGPWHEFDSPRDLTVGRPTVARLDRELFGARDDASVRRKP